MTTLLNHFSSPSPRSPRKNKRDDKHTPSPAKSGKDPNLSDPRFHINRACIYERRLPGNAYITAHVQRLQHGFYSTPAVSDGAFDHVDFLGVSFVFHSPDTIGHRFKAATIRASVRSHARDRGHASHRSHRAKYPRFLMHAPHLLYGAVSPETLQWNYSLTGSIGVAQLPLIASLSPGGGINGRFRRYEMMRIQGSVRSLKIKSSHGQSGNSLDIPAAQIVWTLEENNLQRSGLPREFTFAMLIEKPHADSRVQFVLDIDPVLQSWFGSYPRWWLALPSYRPVCRRRRLVDFRLSVGQRFEPVTDRRGFNFAKLVGTFDDYVYMPGRRFNITDRESLDDNVGPIPPSTFPGAPHTTIPIGTGEPPVTQIPVIPGFDLQLGNERNTRRDRARHR